MSEGLTEEDRKRLWDIYQTNTAGDRTKAYARAQVPLWFTDRYQQRGAYSTCRKGRRSTLHIPADTDNDIMCDRQQVRKDKHWREVEADKSRREWCGTCRVRWFEKLDWKDRFDNHAAAEGAVFSREVFR